MRWIRLLIALIRARFKSRIKASDTLSLPFRVWITDIDVSVMNHATMLTVMETGRVDFMVRSGFLKLAREKKWIFPGRSLTVQYYKPLKIFQKANLHSRISYVDNKWIYMEQKITRNGEDIAACVMKLVIKKGRETVPTSEIIEALNIDKVPDTRFKLIETLELESEQMTEKLVDEWKI